MKARIALVAGVTLVVIFTIFAYPPDPRRVEFPEGKHFAFSIVDDTDLSTLERVQPLYDVLHEHGLRTTKTVWVLDPAEEPLHMNQGHTLQHQAYRNFVMTLQRRGFEIALHGVRGGSSTREDVLVGLDEYERLLGSAPKLHVNHSLNSDNLYWGQHRWTFAPYRWAFGLTRSREFSGHDPDSDFFWGDVARERVRYVRRFTFKETNLLRVNPSIPYRLESTPYVQYWFDGTDGGSIDAFLELLSPENLDRLESEGGVSIVYAHLGAGSFNVDGGEEVDPRFVDRVRDIASRNGWFVPASEILDYLTEQPGWRPELTLRERIRLETAYILDWLF